MWYLIIYLVGVVAAWITTARHNDKNVNYTDDLIVTPLYLLSWIFFIIVGVGYCAENIDEFFRGNPPSLKRFRRNDK